MEQKWEMSEEWKRALLRASKHRNENEDDEEEFLKLVDQAFDSCTLEVGRVLMKTFSAEPDYGTQERVVSALDTASNEILVQVILEELPRLITEAPEWAFCLVGIPVMRNPKLLQEVAANINNEVKSALRNLLDNKEFTEFYPEAKLVKV